jgi:hypothetical protein
MASRYSLAAAASTAARLRADYEKWAPIIAESGFRPEET